jgi:protein phosphatase 1 regulatory subunit 12A
VPPTRDEESETQRKAHAKRVRETRRSTQGVTLDEIKSAEQLVKMKNASNNSNGNVSTTSRVFRLFLFSAEARVQNLTPFSRF